MNSLARKAKRWIALSLALVMTILTLESVQADAATYYIRYLGFRRAYTGVKWKVDYKGKNIDLTGNPGLTIGETGMVPYYPTFCKSGPKCKYKFVKSEESLTLTYGKNTLKMKDQSKVAYLNGVKTSLTQSPRYVTYEASGKTLFMVPVKSVCKLLGIKYSVNAKAGVIHMDLPAASAATTCTQAKVFKSMSTSQFINKIGPLARADYKKSGVLASVTIAQAILESGWGRTELAQNANNIFGMKKSLSGNTWGGSTWDGKSTYTIRTAEYSGSGKYYIIAPFRKYPSVEKSIADHSAYLTHAKNGSSLRYAGLKSTRSYSKQLQIIKNGGYATAGDYVSELSRIITMYNLTKWDK